MCPIALLGRVFSRSAGYFETDAQGVPTTFPPTMSGSVASSYYLDSRRPYCVLAVPSDCEVFVEDVLFELSPPSVKRINTGNNDLFRGAGGRLPRIRSRSFVLGTERDRSVGFRTKRVARSAYRKRVNTSSTGVQRAKLSTDTTMFRSRLTARRPSQSFRSIVGCTRRCL